MKSLAKMLTLMIMITGFALAQEHSFIGVKKCGMCHKKEADGNQLGKWKESPHAGAFATLASEESKKIAAEMGIEDPQKDFKCLKCHVTAAGVDESLIGKGVKMEDGVGCESCHGAGGDYYKKKTMIAITAGEIDGAALGLIEPNEAQCITCHNEESPTYKPFDFAVKVKKVAHPNPNLDN
jgi:nitrate reductase cytochrome c-type subunit